MNYANTYRAIYYNSMRHVIYSALTIVYKHVSHAQWQQGTCRVHMAAATKISLFPNGTNAFTASDSDSITVPVYKAQNPELLRIQNPTPEAWFAKLAFI